MRRRRVRFQVIRTGTGFDGNGEKLVAERKTHLVADEVCRVLQRASDNMGESYTFEVREV